jgi:predicted transcriptional regulator
MDQKQYKKKYGFPMTTPLAAKSVIKVRQTAAQKTGLGEKMKQFWEAKRQEKAQASKSVAAEAVTAEKPKRTRLRKKNVA